MKQFDLVLFLFRLLVREGSPPSSGGQSALVSVCICLCIKEKEFKAAAGRTEGKPRACSNFSIIVRTTIGTVGV